MSSETLISLKKVDPSLFYSRQDPEDERWGDNVKDSPPQGQSCGLWGYSDDQGIRLNGGRPGAQYAPDVIRKSFYKMTPRTGRKNDSKFYIRDLGNWTLSNENGSMSPPSSMDLEKALRIISPQLQSELDQGPMITLGGGHDFGAVDGEAFLNWTLEKKLKRPLIINFDAHLDVRPWKAGLHSGTPFSWLLDHHPNDFDFIEVGIQKHCSSAKHHEWAKAKGVEILDCDFVKKVTPRIALQQYLAGTPATQTCYVSVDIDVFSQALAPGCSQSWDTGLNLGEFMEAFKWLLQNKDVCLLGIYEVSPPLDVDARTSKLAAVIINEFLAHQ